ncbi:MAG TPA: hypothetical protein VJY54_03840 [Lachnospiraceae bacterium]|nr:hypothetical protein [Lachnospiraceae bacterium]
MKTKWLCVFMITFNILCAACGKINEVITEDTGTTLESMETEKLEESEEINPPEFYVVWAVPNIVSISEETVTLINSMLREDGYSYGIQFTYLDFDDYENALQTTEADIVFLGTDSNIAQEAIKSGRFYCLNELLRGSRLYDVMPDQIWGSVAYKDKIYSIPNEVAQDMGVHILFNQDKIAINESESFNGDILTLDKYIQDGGKILYQLSGFAYASYYGYSYQYGILVSEDGECMSPFENKKCMEWMVTMRQWYLEGKVTTDAESEWDICITSEPTSVDEENIYDYATKGILESRYSASTGICSNAKHIKEAFTLLELFHTDTKYGNCLVYGAGYGEKDGHAVNAAGEASEGFINKVVLGLAQGLLIEDDKLYYFESVEDKKTYYDTSVMKSPLLGIEMPKESFELNRIKHQYDTIIFDDEYDQKLEQFKEETTDLITVVIDKLSAVR